MRTDGRATGLRTMMLLVATLALAMAGATIPAAAASAQDVSTQAINHKSPFDCGKTFYANNWTGGHNPSNSIDWQNHGGDAIGGENVRATAAGTAYFYNEGDTSYGRWVQIVHTDGTRTRYAHLATQVRSPGSSMAVDQGTVIGTVGSTGGSTAPHLHYEQRDGSGAVVTPVVDGVQVPLGTKKAVTSTNGCGSGGNPYTPAEVCGGGYDVIDQHALGSAATVYLLYNGSNGANCAVTLKHTDLGKATAVSVSLQVQGGASEGDSGDFGYYAGPVTLSAAATCVKWGGSSGSASWTSDWGHCG